MKRQMLRMLLVFILLVGLATSALAITYIETSDLVIEPMTTFIMILLIGPVSAVIAGLRSKMK